MQLLGRGEKQPCGVNGIPFPFCLFLLASPGGESQPLLIPAKKALPTFPGPAQLEEAVPVLRHMPGVEMSLCMCQLVFHTEN